jgi:platelet-activating factor acetylhydrolase
MTVRLRQVLLYGSASVLFLVLAISLTPITSPLPPYTGDYEVGILDIETEVERRTIHDAVLKETGEKAFEVHYPSYHRYPPQSGALTNNSYKH